MQMPVEPSPTARKLGYAGLLPFVGAAAGTWLLQAPGLQAWAGVALLTYGAVIATFLGGLHWGLAMRGPEPVNTRLVWGVVPSLVAWVALMLPLGAGLLVVAALLASCYAVDRVLYASGGLAGWLTLRLQLTAVAVASCVTGAWALY